MLSLSTLYSGALDFDTLHEKEREHDHALIFDAFNNIVKGYFWMFRGGCTCYLMCTGAFHMILSVVHALDFF
jgi:hypothetical protein